MLKNFLGKLFSGKDNVQPPNPTVAEAQVGEEREIYKIMYLESTEAINHPRLLNDLLGRNIDGMIIRSFIDPSLCPQIVHNFKGHKKYLADTPFGTTIGHGVFSTLNQDLEPYFKSNLGIEEAINELLTFPFEQKFFGLLDTISQQYSFDKLRLDDNEYLTSTARFYPPGMGGLIAHVGDEYIQGHKEKSLFHHHKVLNMDNAFSYFIMMQKPDVGGELKLYDLLYEDTPNELKGFYSNPETQADKMKKYHYQTLKMEPGDLILFRDSNIWHSVSPVQGSKPRVTFGGFFAANKEATAINFWS